MLHTVKHSKKGKKFMLFIKISHFNPLSKIKKKKEKKNINFLEDFTLFFIYIYFCHATFICHLRECKVYDYYIV